VSNHARTMLVDIYNAWAAHDLDRLASYLPNDFSHHMNIPTRQIAIGGTRQGKRATIERLGQIFDGFDTQQIKPGPISVLDLGATLEVETRCLHRSSRSLLHTRKKHVWLLEDGWPVSLSEFYDLEQFTAFIKKAAA
jgi:hypothetical protein